MIRLRELEEKDAPFMLEWMKDSEIQKNFQRNMLAMTLKDAENFCKMSQHEDDIKDGQSLHYAIVAEEDEYLGTISLKNISLKNNSAEYAISTRRCVHGKGVAKEATKLLLHKGFCDLKLRRIYLNVLSDNERAIRFYERCGFIYEGEFRKHLNLDGNLKSLKWFGILDSEFDEKKFE